MSTRAKKHPLLSEVTEALRGKLPQVPVPVLGHTYVLELLMPEAESWVNSHTDGSTAAAIILSAKKPQVAASLRSIDDVPVEKLFETPSDMDPKIKEALGSDVKLLRDWRRQEILEWLSEEVDTFILDELSSAYNRMANRHREELKKVVNFTERTPSVG